MANALYCRGLLDRDAPRMLAAAGRYDDAGRPLFRAKALEAADGYLVDAGDRTQARAAFTTAVERYTSLGAAPRNRGTGTIGNRTSEARTIEVNAADSCRI